MQYSPNHSKDNVFRYIDSVCLSVNEMKVSHDTDSDLINSDDQETSTKTVGCYPGGNFKKKIIIEYV